MRPLEAEQDLTDKHPNRESEPAQSHGMLFAVFNEIGIIHQLSSTVFNRRLPDGLHVSHFSVVNHLMRLGDGKTPLSISRAFQVTKGTMTNTLNGLSSRNLVVLKPHDTDGRSKLVWLTDDGRSFHESAIASLGGALSGLEDELDIKRLEKILPVLSELRQLLDKRRDL